MALKVSTSTSNLQELVDCFDDIPSLMSKISHSNVKLAPNRFQVIEPNQSFGMDLALRGNQSVTSLDGNHNHRLDRMAKQTIKVIDHLATIPDSPLKKPIRNVKETSAIAKEKLQKYSKNNNVDIKKLYLPYDVHRKGRVTYKEFSEALVAASSGIGSEEAHILASNLDNKKTGTIKYENILDALKDLENNASNLINKSSMPTKLLATSSDNEESVRQKSSRISPDHNVYVHSFDDPKVDYYNPRIITRQSLEPTLPIENKTIKKVVDKTIFEERGRRKFDCHNDSSRLELDFRMIANDPLFNKIKSRRSSSAPPGSATSNSLSSVINNNNNNSILMNDKAKSLHNSLLRVSNNTDYESNTKQAIINEKDQQKQIQLDKINGLKAAVQKSNNNNNENTKKIKAKVLENSVITQMNGKMNNLKHILKKQDPSKSGLLNYNEFKSALHKAGISLTPDQMNTLFTNFAGKVTQEPAANIDIGFTNGLAVNIESFVDNMETRNTAPMYSHLHNNANKNDNSNENIRIFKKILYATNKLPDPLLGYQSQSQHMNNSTHNNHNKYGFVHKNELKESLRACGVDLSTKEFNILLESTNNNSSNNHNFADMIEISSLDKKIHEIVNNYDINQQNEHDRKLYDNPRYSSSFKSNNDVLVNYNQPVYKTVQDSSLSHNLELQKWGKLKHCFQKHSKEVLKAFSDCNNQADLEGISLIQLKKNLKKVGILLGKDDFNRLETNIQKNYYQTNNNKDNNSMNESIPKVSLDQFCELMDLRIVSNRNKIEVINPKERDVPGGVFNSSSKTLNCSDNFLTTALIDGMQFDNFTNIKRRKSPMSLSAHLTEPSKFWLMEHGSDNCMAFPYPIPCLRDSLPPPQLRPPKTHQSKSQTLNDYTGLGLFGVKQDLFGRSNEFVRYSSVPHSRGNGHSRRPSGGSLTNTTDTESYYQPSETITSIASSVTGLMKRSNAPTIITNNTNSSVAASSITWKSQNKNRDYSTNPQVRRKRSTSAPPRSSYAKLSDYSNTFGRIFTSNEIKYDDSTTITTDLTPRSINRTPSFDNKVTRPRTPTALKEYSNNNSNNNYISDNSSSTSNKSYKSLLKRNSFSQLSLHSTPFAIGNNFE
eukprot:gene7172-9781_t